MIHTLCKMSSPNSLIRGITAPFPFNNIDENFSSVKNSTKYKSSKYFPGNSINLEDSNIILIFDKKNIGKGYS